MIEQTYDNSISGLWNELYKRNKQLAIAGLGYLILLAILAVVAAFDSSTILGVNRWIKPMKFSSTIAIYLWSMGWLMSYLKNRTKLVRNISFGINITMIGEIIPIVIQAVRGTTSHFNTATTTDAVLWNLMGVMILSNTIFNIYALYLFIVEKPELPASYLWGIRLGILIFIIGTIEGGAMIRGNGHTVGAPDGGPGILFTNWSTIAGDLRVAHFFGIHALQIIPFFGYVTRNLNKNSVIYTTVFSIVYFAYFTFVFTQAMLGRPFAS